MLVKRCTQEVRAIPLQARYASYGEKKILPLDSQQYRYLRFRAIGCLEVDKTRGGFNGNHDGFPYEDFEDDEPGYGYRSFVQKRAHVEHNSKLGKKGSIGDLPDAYLNKFIYPERGPKHWKDLAGAKNYKQRSEIINLPDQRDGAIEVLMRIDTTLLDSNDIDPAVKEELRKIVRAIDTGQQLTCSMGTNCGKSYCSVCGNGAEFPADYCNHLQKGAKGGLYVTQANVIRDLLDSDILRPEWLPHIIMSAFDIKEVLNGISNKGITCKAGEINKKLSFFELSVVKKPAFPAAYALEKVASYGINNRQEYLQELRKQVGDENLIDIYALLQQDGLISSVCGIR